MARVPFLRLGLAGIKERPGKCGYLAPQLESLEDRDLPALLLAGLSLPLPASTGHPGDGASVGGLIATELLQSATTIVQSVVDNVVVQPVVSAAATLPSVPATVGVVLRGSLHSDSNVDLAAADSTPSAHGAVANGKEDRQNTEHDGNVVSLSATVGGDNIADVPVTVTSNVLSQATNDYPPSASGDAGHDFPADAATRPFSGPAADLTNPNPVNRTSDEQEASAAGVGASLQLGQRARSAPVVVPNFELDATSRSASSAWSDGGPSTADPLTADATRMSFDVSPERSAGEVNSAGEVGFAAMDDGDQAQGLLPMARETDDFKVDGIAGDSQGGSEFRMETGVLPHRGMGIARLSTLLPPDLTEIAGRVSESALADDGNAVDLALETVTHQSDDSFVERSQLLGEQSTSTNDNAMKVSVYQQLLGLASMLGLSSYCVQMHRKAKDERAVKTGVRTIANS